LVQDPPAGEATTVGSQSNEAITKDPQAQQGAGQQTAEQQNVQQQTAEPQQNAGPPPPPPTEAELHQKYDVTKEDVAKAGQAVKQYERYSVVAKADEIYADEHPNNQGARARAERSQGFAEKYYSKNVEPFEKTMMGPNGQPKEYLNYEPGASQDDAKKYASRSYIDHKVAPSVTPDNDHIRVANGGTFSSHEIPGMRAEMLRDEARDKARDAVAKSPSNAQLEPAGR
jgi:hypothetical protein